MSDKSLQRALYLERVERARKMTIGERLAAGPELFDQAMERMKIGIRMKNPDANEAKINGLLIKQMDQLKAWKDSEIYQPASRIS